MNKTKDYNVKPHNTLASFDVTNLYTNVPVEETLNILKDNLTKNSKMLPEAIEELMILLREVLRQNYFVFQGTNYSQSDCLAMGSPCQEH